MLDLSRGLWVRSSPTSLHSVLEQDTLTRAVDIPCPTCPTWSHFIEDKLKISIYLSLDKCKIYIKLIKVLHFILLLIIMSSHVALKTVTVWILISWLL